MLGKIECVIVTYNRDDFIITCIQSLQSSISTDLQVDITVIDNGSSDRTEEILSSMADIKYVKNADNIPLPKVLNHGLDMALSGDADYIIILNDDIEMQDGALLEMIEVCNEVPKGIISPLQVDYRNPQSLDSGMRDLLRQVDDLIDDAVYRKALKRFYDLPTIIGAAMLANRDTWERLGNFDDNFSFYGIDDDYCRRALHHNYRLIMVTNAEMYHAHGKTGVVSDPNDKAAWYRRWKSTFHARILFKLKDQRHTLIGNYCRALNLVLGNFITCMLKKFPRGGFVGFTIFFHFLKNYSKIKNRRKKDFFS